MKRKRRIPLPKNQDEYSFLPISGDVTYNIVKARNRVIHLWISDCGCLGDTSFVTEHIKYVTCKRCLKNRTFLRLLLEESVERLSDEK